MLQLPPVYPITDAGQAQTLAEQVRRLGQAGFPLVQFRGKPLDPMAQWTQLRQALQEAHDAGGWPAVVINDRADLAVLAAQEGLTPWGLHLGQEDLPPSEARRLPGLEHVHLGTSTHGSDEWAEVDPACDHAGIGPFRGTVTKADHAAPVGLEGLEAGCRLLGARGLAAVAIGGLTLADGADCFRAGAASLAMVGEVARAESPRELLWKAQVARWRVHPPLIPGRPIVLAGGSGSGKSTLGRALAERASLPFRDLDDAIVAEAGCSIPQLFQREGEAGFRHREGLLARRLLGEPGVLALGGGAWESEAVRSAVREAVGTALWLAEVPETAWIRVGGDPNRPLAQDRATFLARYRSRRQCWWELPMVLPLGRSPEVLAAALFAAASASQG